MAKKVKKVYVFMHKLKGFNGFMEIRNFPYFVIESDDFSGISSGTVYTEKICVPMSHKKLIERFEAVGVYVAKIGKTIYMREEL
jgi:hypothetical protein